MELSLSNDKLHMCSINFFDANFCESVQAGCHSLGASEGACTKTKLETLGRHCDKECTAVIRIEVVDKTCGGDPT